MQTPLEKRHVQQVYEEIATHFSETRYKPWPLVEKHIKSLPSGSIVYDIGCGNGKYLGCNPNIFSFGSDQSKNLITICKNRGFECLVADGLSLPFRDQSSDHVISIAVVHHFSNRENRLAILQEMKRVVRIGGTVLVTVWAFEQVKKKYHEQDVMIKWHLQSRFSATAPPKQSKQKKSQKNLDLPVSSNSELPTSSENSVEENVQAQKGENLADRSTDSETSKVLERYYHLFVKNELDELFLAVGGFEILESVWDVDNWYVVARRIE